MSVIVLHNVDQAEVPKKSHEDTTIASENIGSTNWQQIGNDDGYDLGSNPGASCMLDWTIGSATAIKFRVKVSHDGVKWQWAPSLGVPSSGDAAASIAQITYTASDWDIGGGVSRLPVDFEIPGWRRFQVWVQSNHASGSITGSIRAAA